MENITLNQTEPDGFLCASGISLMRFICNVAITMPISILGIVGNILGFIVWHKQHHSPSSSLLLQSLAVTDTLILVMAILLNSLRYIQMCGAYMPLYDEVYRYIFVVAYPSLYVVRLAGTWITTLLTINRWIAVCHPLHVQRLVTKRSVTWQLAIIAVFSLVFSLPRFFEYQLAENTGSSIDVLPTDLARNRPYSIVYKIILFLVVMYLTPIIILIIFNTKLILALRRAEIDVKALKQYQQQSSSSAQQKKSITIIVVTVVVIFLLCNFVALTSHILYSLELAFPSLTNSLESTRRNISNISNVMVIFNSAVNFLIYCLCSHNFRMSFMGTFASRNLQRHTTARRTISSGSAMTYVSVSKGTTLSEPHIPLDNYVLHKTLADGHLKEIAE